MSKCQRFGTWRHIGIEVTPRTPDIQSKINDIHVFHFGGGLALSVVPHCQGGTERCPKPMMKIQLQESGGELTMQIEGRLAGAFVPELESCWRSARVKQPDQTISLDLKNVTCVDRAGRYLLQLMHESGVHFLRASLSLQDILEQIAEKPECRQ